VSAPRAEITYRTSVRDANAAGDVHGGWVLKLLDDAAVIAATRHCRRTSMEVGVRVEAENTLTETTKHVLTAYLTMVALDGEGATTKVPDLEIDGPDASRRWREAQLRRDIRLAAPGDLHQLHAALRASTARELVP
jgi:acyl-CoA hydrolase